LPAAEPNDACADQRQGDGCKDDENKLAEEALDILHQQYRVPNSSVTEAALMTAADF
jgi:hypothetical protein